MLPTQNKMKFVLVAVFLFATVFANDSSSGESESWEEDLQDLAKFIKGKYNITIVYEAIKLLKLVESKCPSVADKVEFAVKEAEECMRDIDVGSDTLCSAVQKNWAKCSKPGIDAVISCLPEQARDFPIFIGKIFGGIIQHVCGSTVEEVLEFFNPCMHEVHSRSMPECAECVRIVHNTKNDDIPTKDTMCSLTEELRKCGKAHEDISCKNPITRRASNHLYEALKDNIKDFCTSSNKA